MPRWFRKRNEGRGNMQSDRQPLSQVLAECAGNWIAVDRSTNELRAAASSADLLAIQIREKGLRNVAILRAPDASEPELVGLG